MSHIQIKINIINYYGNMFQQIMRFIIQAEL